MKKRHDRATIEELLRQRDTEGLTYKVLAERSGIPLNTLLGWAYRLRKEKADRDPQACEGGAFVELGVANDGERVEIRAGNARISVRRGFDPQLLREVLAALEC